MPSLHQRLRDATREKHEWLERYPFFQALMNGKLPLSSYVAWLRTLTTVVGVLEWEVEDSTAPDVSGLWRPDMRKLPLLRADAAAFDSEPSTAAEAVQPTLELVEALRRWGRDNPAGLIGALYVFEGSALGAKVLRKKLAEQYRLRRAGLSYVSAYGRSVRLQWQTFCDRLNALELSSEDEARVVAAASAVLEKLGRIVAHLHPAQDDAYAVLNMLNLSAGGHEVTRDPRELLASIDAGVRTWAQYPYFEARYGDRGRCFTRSDGAWLVTLAYCDMERTVHQIDWLAGLLSHRGMPSLLLEEHLFHLQEALVRAVPERADHYRQLGANGERLRAKRLAALPGFDRVAASFGRVRPLANVGPIIAGAVVDERFGIDDAVDSVVRWLTGSQRFSADWISAVERTVTRARSSAAASGD